MRKLLAIFLAVGWTVSLALPVAVTGSQSGEVWPGFAVLIIGPLGVLVMQFAWFANVLFVVALVLMLLRQPPSVTLSLVVAVPLGLLALDALRWDRIEGDNGHAMILSYGAGYYLWLGVMLAAAAALAVTAFIARSADVASASPTEAG